MMRLKQIDHLPLKIRSATLGFSFSKQMTSSSVYPLFQNVIKMNNFAMLKVVYYKY